MSYVEPPEENQIPELPAPTGPSQNELNLQRENAILRALPGVDLSTPLGTMFAASYSGELAGEAIKASASAIGLLAPASAETPPETPPPAPTSEELQLQQLREGVGASGTGVLPPATPDEIEAARMPSEVGFQRMREAMEKGQPREDAAAAWINSQVAAAARGDQRAQFNGWTEDQLARR